MAESSPASSFSFLLFKCSKKSYHLFVFAFMFAYSAYTPSFTRLPALLSRWLFKLLQSHIHNGTLLRQPNLSATALLVFQVFPFRSNVLVLLEFALGWAHSDAKRKLFMCAKSYKHDLFVVVQLHAILTHF